MEEKEQKEKEQLEREPSGKRGLLLRLLYFPLAFVYLELVFYVCAFHKAGIGMLSASLAALALGGICGGLAAVFSRRVNRILSYVLLAIPTVYFLVQLIYYAVFLRFLSLNMVTAVGGDVLQFMQQIVHTVLRNWYGVLLLLLPLVLWIVCSIKWVEFERLSLKEGLCLFGGALVSRLLFVLCLFLFGTEPHSAYDLYFYDWEQELGTQRLGLFTTAQKDIAGLLFSQKGSSLDELTFGEIETEPTTEPLPEVTLSPTQNPTPALTPVPTAEPEVTQTPLPTVMPTETPTPVVVKEQVLYDFPKLAEEEDKEEIQKLHRYFASVEPSKTNEYTGMFEGYNLIMLTAEGFSPWAVDENLTPTLYKLTHSGFVFENFYTPLWYTSTSDGEYVACTGLIPSGTNSMTKSADNAMPFAFGNRFKRLGYLTKAYHNHSYSYYHRDLSHPNLGYDYKGIGNGLELPFNGWPRSDYEMMQVTVPEYIGTEPFHVYYMTVSGHMEYTFIDNSMSKRNKEVVQKLPYSDEAKAYIACNYELEKALTCLLAQLEAAGIADHTVIALSADHYPYGLEKQYIDELAGHTVEENFELYENYFILWCAGMEESVIVDKYCSSLDIAPTLCNLFGLPYDSRLYMGNDILSDSAPLVIFSNKSFITDKVMYNSKTGETTLLTEEELPEGYVKAMLQVVKNKFIASDGVLRYDYYSYLPEAE